MGQQGLLCFEMLSDERLQELHLAALRLLLAISGGGDHGGNDDVQDILLAQLTSAPNEMAAKAMRRMLRTSVEDLKVLRKAMEDGAVTAATAAVTAATTAITAPTAGRCIQ